MPLPKTTRDTQLDLGIARARAMHARYSTVLAALPAPAVRTNAQKNTARDARDWMLITRMLLLVVGAAEAGDILDGTGVE